MSVKATTKYIWFNGEMVPWSEAKVHVMTHALHYGTSVFETVTRLKLHLLYLKI